MRISSISSTYCFVTRGDRLAQVVRVVVAGGAPDGTCEVRLDGEAVSWTEAWRGSLSPALAGEPGGPAWAPSSDAGLVLPARFTAAPALPDGVVVEVPVCFAPELPAGSLVQLRAVAGCGDDRAEAGAEVVVREPGWRMLMVPHFHYDPVWWNTQAGYTSGWDELLWAQERRETFQHSGLALVEAHLERARVDPAYKVVFAEVDYLKPFWDLYPDRREELRALIGAGRVEIVGGTYNEPNTNLTGAETAIRAAVHGIGFQRDVMGADPQSAWQLDVFGHDPQFPGIMAECGLGSSAWARGPFHQWGPKQSTGSTGWMQFPSEFEWVGPNGRGLLTSYMPNHYSAGWELERAVTIEGAMWRAYELLEDLAQVSATKLTLLPVGTDYTPPSRWVTEVARAWAQRYIWPRLEVALPREFFAAVRSEMEREGRVPSPQTRDMGPVYTGKDVSFIDTKQAQRLAEANLADAETLAGLASLVGMPPPRRALDKAWRLLVFGAHHDGITGSESDQVYLDLVGGWREAFELARDVAERSEQHLSAAVSTRGDADAAVVFNTLGWDRSDLVVAEVPAPPAGTVLEIADEAGRAIPVLCEPSSPGGSVRVSFWAQDVPGVGHRTYRARQRQAPAAGELGWVEAPGLEIANESLVIAADPERGGGLAGITDKASGFSLVPEGEVGNELLVYPEHPNHPSFGEGPWHLLPSGPPARSGAGAAAVRRERSGLGERLVVTGALEGFRYRQVVTLWRGARRAELRTEIHGWALQDHLLRLRFPTTLEGGTAVSAVGDAVVARGFGLIDVDAAEAPWTLDSPAAEWFGLSTTLVVEAAEAGRSYHRRSVGVGEVVTPVGSGAAPWARRLVVALVQKGVTSTCTEADRNRYGALVGDSNLPDFRIAVGGPGENEFVAAVLQSAAAGYREELAGQLDRQGWARVLVPAERPLREVWQPGADLRGPRALPVLVVAGRDDLATEAAVDALVAEVAAGRVTVDQSASLVPVPEQVPEWTVAILNRGTPGFAVGPGGSLHVSLLRACTGWPSGVWIDPPRRSAPDGSAFELEHWSHVFENALVAGRGDWREAGCVQEALAFNRPLRAVVSAAHAGVLGPTSRLLAVHTSRVASSAPPPSPAAPSPAAPSPAALVLAAVKPAGNPLATGDQPGDGRALGHEVELAVRCYEAAGRPAKMEIDSRFPVVAATRANLLEEPGEPLDVSPIGADAGAEGAEGPTSRVSLSVGAGEILTVRLRLGIVAEGVVPASADGDRGAEVAQPVFSRYWLHNKGPAPIGNQALAVHIMPTALVLRAGETCEVTAQVASGSAHATQAGQLQLLGPQGWALEPSGRLFSLAPGAWTRAQVRVRVPESCRPGRYFVSARAVDGAGQAQEDVVTVDVVPALAEAALADAAQGGAALAQAAQAGAGHAGGRAPLGARAVLGAQAVLAKPAPIGHPAGVVAAELEAAVEAVELEVAPSSTATLGLMLTNRTAGELRGELQLISPIETWPYVGPWSQPFRLGPGERRRYVVVASAPGQGWLASWVLFKVMYFGRIWYSPAVALRLGAEPVVLGQAAPARRGWRRHASNG